MSRNMAVHIRWKRERIICTGISLIVCFVLLTSFRHKTDNTVSHISNELIEWSEPNVIRDHTEPGERGKGIITLTKDEDKSEASYKEYGFNQFISDKISVHRTLLDVRPIVCHYQKYQSVLPKVSVIIIFHEEGWSTLLRTVHSVLNRSPPELLHEIVLCDDFSTKDHLKSPLDEYIAKLPKVKLVRTKEREGLIRAKVYGADHSTGEVLLFLDSHCEVNAGWLPPLLSEIATDYKRVVCPTIDFINHKDFSYLGGGSEKRGVFNWRFDYKEKELAVQDFLNRKSPAEPIKSPVMAGGLFAISRKFWLELGKYDTGMYVWGGEQYELSFKLWMCGGTMLNLPCSRVGHVYRKKIPYKANKMNAALVNFKRVAEVWMDDFKEFLYYNRLDILAMPTGDISERKALRARLKCHDFRWYLDNVANETVRTRFEPDRASGHIRHIEQDTCLDTLPQPYGRTTFLSKCDDSNNGQKFKWTYINEFRKGLEDCLDVREGDAENVRLERCHELGRNQVFKYLKKTKQIHHVGTGRCLAIDKESSQPVLQPCEGNSKQQKWKLDLQNVNVPVPEWAKIAESLKYYRA